MDLSTQFRRQHYVNAADVAAFPSIMFAESNGLRFTRPDGYVTTELMTLPESGLTIGRIRSTGHEIDLLEADRLTVLLPRMGHLAVRVAGRLHVVRPDEPTAFRPGERTTTASVDRSGRFVATTLQIPMDRIRALAAAAETPGASVFQEDVVLMRNRIEDQVLCSLALLSDDIFLVPGSPVPAKVMRAVGNWIDEQLLAAIEGPAEDALHRIVPAFHRVRQAEEIMRSQGDEPLSMLDLAQQLGVSLRSLQLAFRLAHDGQSPRDYFNRIRLEQARIRLLSANAAENVTTIALDCGFSHLGRFSQTYARAFGERPSDTLARRRA